MAIDPSRLYSTLLNTGLQQKDNALYQVIRDLIDNIIAVNKKSNSSSSGSSGSTGAQGIQGLQGIPGFDGIDGEDALVIQGPRGTSGSTGAQGPIGPILLIEDGIDGLDGQNIPIPGPQGVIGLTGPAGPTGPAGNTPAFPIIFFDGVDGEDGLIGAQGPQGIPGTGGNSGTPPGPISGWTGINIGSNWTGVDDVGGAIEIIETDSSSVDWRFYIKAQPATPYTKIFQFDTYQTFANSCLFGCYFYDGTKFMGIELVVQATGLMTLRVEKLTNFSTDFTTAFSVTPLPIQLLPFLYGPISGVNQPHFVNVYFRLGNTGSTLTFDWSRDGATWHNIFSEAVGTFITPTSYGFGGLNDGTGAPQTMIMKSIT